MRDARRSKRTSFARTYAHVSAFGGALSLLNVFKDIVEWRSFFAGFIVWWQQAITPLARGLFFWLEIIWPWPWPDWGYDYVVLCILMGLGVVRLKSAGFFSFSSEDVEPGPFVAKPLDILILLLAFVLVAIFWPVLFMVTASGLIGGGTRSDWREVLPTLFIFLMPFMYFMGLLLLNYALFFA